MIMNKISLPISLVLVLFFLVSCENETKEDVSFFYSELIKTDEGLIRGVNINDGVKQIKKHEKKSALVSETPAIIEYEYDLGEGSYVMLYHVDAQGCSEINMDTYFETEEQAIEIVGTYQRYFSGKYGEAEVRDDLFIWRVDDGAVTIELDHMNQIDGEVMLTIIANE